MSIENYSKYIVVPVLIVAAAILAVCGVMR